MIAKIRFIFWMSVGCIIYAFAGYPLVLKLISMFVRKPVHKADGELPFVTLIISAYNEEKIIAQKIENSLDLDYPKDLLEIIVVSDASSDRTEEIALSYKDKGVRTLRIEGRVGKSSCLNSAVPPSMGEVIVFSDANSIYPKQVIRKIVQNFTDNSIGCVTGYTRYISRDADAIVESLSLYSRLEMVTKELESIIGSCVGADGAIFAIRKSLFRPLRKTDINDFVIPLMVVAQGYRSIIEKEAFCFEETAKDASGEFNRQVRITNRTIRAIFSHAYLLDFRRYGVFSFELLSHKLMKFFVPLFLIMALSSNCLLIWGRGFYRILILIQGLFYVLSSPWVQRYPFSFIEKIAAICRTFLVVNLAVMKGWITYLKGEDFTVWKSTR